MKTSKFKRIFDKKYFRTHYLKTTGEFGDKELIRNKNWFYGWFKSLKYDYDFENGKGNKVMEIGCAIGAAADILHNRGFDILATDISSHAIEKSKKLLPHIKFMKLDIERPIKIKDKFELIYAFEVIEHLQNPEIAIKNIFNLLNDTGRLILSTPVPHKYTHNSDGTHINIRYPEEWVTLLRKCGFKKIYYTKKTFIPFFYRISKYFHFILPFDMNNPYLNTHVFIVSSK